MTEDEMVGWHHRLDGHEFEQALRVGDGQGSLACCSPWSLKELNTTEQLNSNNRHQTARDSPYAPEVSQSISQSTGSSQNLANPTPLPYLSCPQSFRLLLH